MTGTANRGIYQIAVLVDPTEPIEPWSTEQPWNRKYVNTFGGACSVNYQQPTVGDVRNVARLGLGFAVGTSSLNTYANSCSDVISAEALMMTKEIVTERWGPILYTIGDGGSRRNDAAAHDLRRLPRAAERPHDEPALRGPLVPGRRLVRLPAAVPLLRAGRRRRPSAHPGWGDGSNNPLFPDAAARRLVYGTNPSNPDAKCSQKIGFTVAELIANSASGCAGPPDTPPWRWDRSRTRAARAARSRTT